jgi:hypothetical protein
VVKVLAPGKGEAEPAVRRLPVPVSQRCMVTADSELAAMVQMKKEIEEIE